MNKFQHQALQQLRDIEIASDGAFQVLPARPSSNGWVSLEVSLDCSNFEKSSKGLSFRAREKFLVVLSPKYPFEPPSTRVLHKRFAGYPHVQWTNTLCLYQAPSTEWDASDGMFGYMARLELWLKHAAKANLDPDDAPLHPPVAYPYSESATLFVPRADIPFPTSTTSWVGVARLKKVSDYRIDLVEWHDLLDQLPSQAYVAPAFLLNENMPFEFPTSLLTLVNILTKAGIPLDTVYLAFQLALLRNAEDAPLYAIIGTPMRGIRAQGNIQFHLAVWKVRDWMSEGLRIALRKYSDDPKHQEFGKEVEELVTEFVQKSEIEWCKLREDRPQVTHRRDRDSIISSFAGKTVAVWGCGALGSYTAEYLTRAGIKKIYLVDSAIVAPGLLVRQDFEDLDIGQNKVEALSARLNRIRLDLLIQHTNANLLEVLSDDEFPNDIEIVLDTTASNAVLTKLESARHSTHLSTIPIASMAIGHDATCGLAVTVSPGFTGGPLDAIRKTKIEICRNPDFKIFADEFWPLERRSIFQPEPGCSDPTFLGSAADTCGLAAMMLNAIAKVAFEEHSPCAHAITIDLHPARAWSRREFKFLPDITIRDKATDFDIRISHNAWHDLAAWIRRTERTSGTGTETGGVLFGERDDAAGVFWIDEVLGPPPDSVASAKEFICGVQGTQDANNEKKVRTRNSVQYIGMWHTHPGGSPRPSLQDLQSMGALVAANGSSPQSQVFMIIGGKRPNYSLCTCVYRRDDLISGILSIGTTQRNIPVIKHDKVRDIGLALSGGGSRAIAFHLGCLRALHDKDLLNRIQVISSVSGGSVIAGMFAYSHDDFQDFDSRVVELLKKGFAKSILAKIFSPSYFPKILFSIIVSGLSTLVLSLLWLVANLTGLIKLRLWFAKNQTPFRRWYSRTTAFEKVLEEQIFGQDTLDTPRRNEVDIVINACELRTGTAFRFGSKESGSWRYYRRLKTPPRISQAVAASAASPVLLPSIDRKLSFVDKHGNTKDERVILTDGGIIDNLGITAFDPDRKGEFSTNVFHPAYIICCSASPGQSDGQSFPYSWLRRMSESFEAVFRKSVSHGYGHLHQWASTGKIRGFVLAYLGQQDNRLPCKIAGLVPRERVSDYPTDFSAMSETDIRLLADRGEQLTRNLLSHHRPDLC